MRTATKKLTQLSHTLPRAKKVSHLALVKARKLSTRSYKLMKQKPLVTLGAAIAVSAASGLLLWLGMRK